MKKKILPFIFIFIISCASKSPVRHLSSDVCLLMPENNSKVEVEKILGRPDLIQTNNESGERWIYYQTKKSFLKKMPLIGSKYGQIEYDLVVVSFDKNLVKKCIFRSLTKDEMANYGVMVGE